MADNGCAHLTPSSAPDLQMCHTKVCHFFQVIVPPGVGEVYDEAHLQLTARLSAFDSLVFSLARIQILGDQRAYSVRIM